MIRIIIATILAAVIGCGPCVAAVGSWNGVAFTAWNGVAQTSWNGTAISCASGAAPAFVQSATNKGVATSVAVSISPTAGNLLVAVVVGLQGDSANHVVTDSGGGTWTNVARLGAAGVSRISMFYSKNIGSGITSVTCDSGTSGLITVGLVCEVSGCSTSSPFTGGETATNDNSGVASTAPETGSVTNATAASIFFGIFTSDEGGNPSTMTLNASGTVGTWTLGVAETNGNTWIACSVPYYVASSSASTKHVWTTDSRPYRTIIAAFHP